MTDKIKKIIRNHRPFPKVTKYDTYVDESWIDRCANEIYTNVLKNMESSSRIMSVTKERTYLEKDMINAYNRGQLDRSAGIFNRAKQWLSGYAT